MAALGISGRPRRALRPSRLARAPGQRRVHVAPTTCLLCIPAWCCCSAGFEGLHVGGKSALDWYGVRQYVAQQPMLQLYGWDGGPVAGLVHRSGSRPSTTASACSMSSPAHSFTSRPSRQRSGAPMVSSPERALLEAAERSRRAPAAAGSAASWPKAAYSLRADVLRELLQALHQRQDRAAVPATRPRAVRCRGLTKLIRRRCPPAAIAPGSRDPRTVCWCSSR
ncbi:MAG: hypothetical protein MZW92_78020 [Comamonadaceae bacterium]|nr:hypothetical protein [Comamonadaceae bacterium]